MTTRRIGHTLAAPMQRSSSRVRTGLVIIAALALILVGLYWSRRSGSSAPTRAVSAGEVAPGDRVPPATEAKPTRKPPAPRPRRRPGLTSRKRNALAAAIEAARRKRAASPAGRARPQSGTDPDTPAEPLRLANKTGSDSDWEKRQIQTLSELFGECVQIAEAETPGVEGTVMLLFQISGEPDIGGLVDEVEFNEDQTSIAPGTLRECVRESLYALELDPPPEGVQVKRQISLRLGSNEDG